MPTAMKLPVAVAFLLCAGPALAQTNLGELLDAGAKPLSAQEFKEALVQRVVVGPTPTGGRIEVMYTTSGGVQGTGHTRPAAETMIVIVPINGAWTLGDDGKVCTSMRIGIGQGGGNAPPVVLPPRCQFWFKHGEQYFLSDSDSDRGARVLLRTLKQ